MARVVENPSRQRIETYNGEWVAIAGSIEGWFVLLNTNWDVAITGTKFSACFSTYVAHVIHMTSFTCLFQRLSFSLLNRDSELAISSGFFPPPTHASTTPSPHRLLQATHHQSMVTAHLSNEGISNSNERPLHSEITIEKGYSSPFKPIMYYPPVRPIVYGDARTTNSNEMNH